MHAQGQRSHAIAFGLVGLIGGVITALQFQISDSGFGAVVMLLTPCIAACVGALVASKRRWVAATIGFALLGGVVNGTSIGLVLSAFEGFRDTAAIAVGAYFGVGCALPFLPALLFIAFAGRRIGRARPQSVIDGIDRRALTRATVLVCLLGSAYVVRLIARGGGYHMIVPWIVVLGSIACCTFLWVVISDLVAHDRLRRFEHASAAWRPTTEVELPPAAPDFVDVGMGEEHYVRVDGPYTFREAPSVRLMMTGDPSLGVRLARRALFVDIAGILLVASLLANVTVAR